MTWPFVITKCFYKTLDLVTNITELQSSFLLRTLKKFMLSL